MLIWFSFSYWLVEQSRGRDWSRPWSYIIIMKAVGKTQGRSEKKSCAYWILFFTITCFHSCKQVTLGTVFHSKLDSPHSYFIVISHPPNWLCLKHISGLDCGNWGLSRPNSHVITTGAVSPLPPPKCTSSFLPGSNVSFHLSLPAGQESNLMDVFTQTCCQWWEAEARREGGQWCKKQEPFYSF